VFFFCARRVRENGVCADGVCADGVVVWRRRSEEMNDFSTTTNPIARSLFRHRRRRDVLRALLVPLDLRAYRLHARGLHEHASVVEVGDDKLALRRGEVVQVENVLFERDVGGDHDAVHRGHHGRRARRRLGARVGGIRVGVCGVVASRRVCGPIDT